ncbi:5672_t:CDS:2, partial [Acaulospora colombiana]
EILARYGKEYTWELKSRMMGLREYEAAVLLVNETKIDLTAEEYLKERNEKQALRFPHAKPMPGVMVATSSKRDKFNIKATNNQELFGLFDSIICGDDPGIKNGKPAPDLFLAACARMGNPPVTKCLVFEDAINGVEAARNAGMHVVWVPDPNLAALYPGDNAATKVISSLEDFNPAKFGLPAFGNHDES